MSLYHGFLIYGLKDPKTGQVRYVGKSSSGMKRPSEHFRAHKLHKKCHKSSWIKSLAVQGLQPEIIVLETLDSKDALSDAEMKWIAHLKAQGHPLTNHTVGGEGVSGWKHSPETKNKIGKASKARQTKTWIAQRVQAFRVSMKSETLRAIYSKAKGMRPFEVYDSSGRFLGVWENVRKCCRDFSLDSGSVSRVLKGEYSHTKGFTMKFVEVT